MENEISIKLIFVGINKIILKYPLYFRKKNLHLINISARARIKILVC